MNILEEITAHKKQEIEKLKQEFDLEKLKKLIKTKEFEKRNFYKEVELKVKKKEIALITEIKKASPSKGILRKDFDYLKIAKEYTNGGACCLSILTDKKFFQGDLNHLQYIKKVTNLPLLRKDFIIDTYQIFESVYNEADCILLIVSVLDKDMLKRLLETACENQLDILIEVHNEREIEIALNLTETLHKSSLLGINNRDLTTFETNINTTIKLVEKYKHDLENKIIISESGILTKDNIKTLTKSNVYGFLVGESLITSANIEEATKKLLIG